MNSMLLVFLLVESTAACSYIPDFTWAQTITYGTVLGVHWA